MEIRQFIFDPNGCHVTKVSNERATIFVDSSVPAEVLQEWYRQLCARERRWLAYRRRLRRQETRRVLRRVCLKRRRSKIRRYKHIALRLRCRQPVR
jgi:hypothetical protein